MKKLFVLLMSSIVLVSCNNSQKSSEDSTETKAVSTQSVRIKGSETVLPISEKAVQVYLKDHEGANLMVTGGGSGVGISSLLNKSTDIAQTSRKIKFSEKQKIEADGRNLKEVIIAYDALAVIVHPENKVNNLTREQLEDIFTGKIKNWSELGGDDLEILPYSRETSSGTYEFFKDNVMSGKNYASGIMSMPANGSIIQSVGQTKGAISYVGVAYINQSVQPVSVSFDQGETFVAPTAKNVKNESYPIVRPLYYYYLVTPEQPEKEFMDFILSDEGQKIVEEVGYISIR